MLRRDGEVFRLGTAMAGNSFNGLRADCPGQQGGVGSGKTAPIQAKSLSGPGIKDQISTL